MAGDVYGLKIEDIVAAIMGDTDALTADEVQAMETLLDCPDLDSGQKQEFIRTLYNIVAGIIEIQWLAYAEKAETKGCGKPLKISPESRNDAPAVLSLKDKKTSRIFREASTETTGAEQGDT